MTAAHNRALQVVPDPRESPDADDAQWIDRPSAETIAAQWEPEFQLVGALLWHTAAQAKPILAAVPDAAIWRPITRWAYVMYSRTLFGSLKRLAFGTLLRRGSALAANPRIYALRDPVIDEAPR